MKTSWSAAKRAGDKWYFTGRSCKQGHVEKRLTSNGCCYTCQKEREQSKHGREYGAARSCAYRRANPEKIKAANARRDMKAMVAYNKRPEVKAKADARLVAIKDTPEYKASRCARSTRRYAMKKQRTPVWANREWIEHAYFVAADMTAKMGESFQVDHEIPLCGKTVSGLHVYENLQILPALENQRKNRKFPEAA